MKLGDRGCVDFIVYISITVALGFFSLGFILHEPIVKQLDILNELEIGQ